MSDVESFEEEDEYLYEEDYAYYETESEPNSPVNNGKTSRVSHLSGDQTDVEAHDESMSKDNINLDISMSSHTSSTTQGTGLSSMNTSRLSAKKMQKMGGVALSIPSDGYVITDYREVHPLMNSIVDSIVKILDLHSDVAMRLLIFNDWDEEKLMDAYCNNYTQLLEEAGVDLFEYDLVIKAHEVCLNLTNEGDGKMAASDETFSCGICRFDNPKAESYSLGCKHNFCMDCYNSYIHHQINEGRACVKAHCPEPKCKQALTKTIISVILSSSLLPSNAEDLQKYNTYLSKNFIETSKNMRYCPAPRCNKVALGSGVSVVRCTCSYPFCFKCGEEGHDPCSCQQLSDWNEKCMNESETANWILVNTKKCPNCNVRIEKSQGCNHMNCEVCKHQFCWICMGEWNKHGQETGGFYKCNRYDPKNTASNEKEIAKAELDRYLHYYQRFVGHNSSLQFAASQRQAAEKRMIEHQEAQNTTWIDVQFLKQATEQVIDCRRVLKYTYVLGYFLPDNSPEKQLFEHHQEMLEKNTDLLHELTEQNMETIDRSTVVNLKCVTERFMSSLLSTMTGGVVIIEESNMNVTPNSFESGVKNVTSAKKKNKIGKFKI